MLAEAVALHTQGSLVPASSMLREREAPRWVGAASGVAPSDAVVMWHTIVGMHPLPKGTHARSNGAGSDLTSDDAFITQTEVPARQVVVRRANQLRIAIAATTTMRRTIEDDEPECRRGCAHAWRRMRLAYERKGSKRGNGGRLRTLWRLQLARPGRLATTCTFKRTRPNEA